VDFRALVESTVDLVAVFDREYRYVYVNPAYERATGIASADILGKLAGETRTPDAVDRWREAISDVLANGTQRTIEHTVETPRGHRRFSSSVVAAGEHACVFSRDVTDVQAMRGASYLAQAGALLEHFDPETSLQAIVELAVPALADAAFIHLKTSGAPIIAAVAHAERAKAAALRGFVGAPRALSSETAVARVLAGGPAELVQVDDDTLVKAAVDGADLDRLRAQGYRSSVVAPLTGRDGVLGAITFSTTDSGRRFDQADLAMLGELARRTGIALDNARLFAAEQHMRRRAEDARDRTRALQALTTKLHAAVDEAEVTAIMVDAGSAALGAAAGFAWLLASPDTLQLSAAEPGKRVDFESVRTIPLATHLPICDAVKTGRPMMFESLAAMRAGYPDVESLGSYRAWAVIPFVAGGSAIGGVSFSFAAERRFSEEDRELLVAMMGQASLALERGKLLAAERTARQQAEAARVRERQLHALAAKLSSALTVAQAAAIVCEEVVSTLGVYFAAAALRDGDRIRIVGSSRVHHPAEVARTSNLPLATPLPIAEAVAREEIVWCTGDVDLARRYLPFQEIWRPTGIRAWGAIPFTFEGRTVGSVALSCTEERELTEDERVLLRAIGQLAAQAIERARLYEALRESEQKLRDALTAARAGMWRVDVRTMQSTRDASFAAAFGVRSNEQVPADFGSCHPEDVPIAHRAFERSLAEDVPYDPVVRMSRGDGTYVWTRTLGRLLRDATGQPLAMTGVTFDIDEARRTSEVNETLYRLGAEFAKELDHDRLVRLITEEVVGLVGADGGAFWYQLDRVAQTIRVGNTQDLVLPPARGAVRANDGHQLAVPVTGATGEPFGVLVLAHHNAGYFTDAHERLVTGIANHASVALENARLYRAVREHEQELVAAVERARDADRRKDEFLAMLGHELRNPLAPISTAIDLLDLKCGAVAQRERDAIRRHVVHMSRLVDDLLDVSRVTRGGIQLAKERVELSSIVARAIETASPLLEQKQQAVLVDVARDGLLVDADPVRLAQVFQNLLLNASKYSGPQTEIRICARASGDAIVVEVSDRGTGIAPELLPQLFETFVQGKRTIERAEGGLGIGLTIAKSLCELHGGSITAASDGPGTGSTFTVTLPRAGRRAMRVLVVDDNVDLARTLHAHLAKLGHEPAIAHDAPSALDVAAAFRPDIAVLDIGLPQIDGYQLARKLREQLGADTLRLIAMSSYGDADHARATDAGFEHHLVKPIALEALTTLLRK
jgi:PAS domain S-box-containing protein